MVDFQLMLSCHKLSHPDQKNLVLKSFLDQETYWVVNDLTAKFWMQTYLRQNLNQIICGDVVLRASELWHQLLLKRDPQWQIITPDLAQFFIEKWLPEGIKLHDLSISNKDRSKAYQTIGQILPLLCHFQGEDALEEWFEGSEDAKDRWYEWYKAGRFLWNKFSEKKMIPSEWIKGLLIHEELEFPSSRIVIDLGLDIDDVEGELILNLSRITDVEVIVPHTDEPIEAYEDLMSRCQPNFYDDESFEVQRVYKKLPSMLSEVKDAVAQVRQWLDEGVSIDRIALVSPAIENYWPTLSEYLLVEGIPADKNIVSPLSQFEVYQSWLSSIRFALSRVQASDGQQFFYTDDLEPEISYANYKQLFKNVYEKDDFNRLDEAKKKLPSSINPEDQVSFGEFINWSMELFKADDSQSLDKLLQNFDEIYIVDETLSYEKWLEFFENYFSRSEKTIERWEGEGLAILSPSGVLNLEVDKLIFLGLSEANLVESQQTSLHWTDIESIKIKFGFNLPHADRNKTLQLLSWIEKKNMTEVIHYHAETDFSGQFQSPSLYWLKGAVDKGHDLEIEAPKLTRWDELMLFSESEDLNRDKEQLQSLEKFIDRDLGVLPTPQAEMNISSLSSSSLEEYFKCPFRFFAQKSLHLTDLPSLDLDIDYMTRGRLIHKICEEVVKGQNFKLNDDQLINLVDQSRIDIEMEVYDEKMWEFFRPFYLKMARRFMEFENQWRSEFPGTETYATEKFIKTKIAVKDNKVFFTAEEGINFRGVIDRIDKNSKGQYVILDYKSSNSGLTAYKSWLNNGKLQLALYSLAMQEGAVTGEAENVVGAFYYVIKNLERSKGFVTNEATPDFLPSKKMTPEDRDQLLEDTRTLTFNIVDNIKRGEIEPRPHDLKICNDCQWNKVCRYPNLNL